MSDDMGDIVEDWQAERSEAESEVIRLRADLEKMTGERDELRGELEAESIRRLNQLDELRERLRIAIAERDVALRDRNDARRDFEAMRDWRDNMMRQRDEAISRAEKAEAERDQWASERAAYTRSLDELLELKEDDGYVGIGLSHMGDGLGAEARLG
jgi:hypothetical protein